LRNAVAEIGERQPLEHDVSQAAIGRRFALLSNDQRVRRLRLTAAIGAHRQPGEIERLTVRPHTQHSADRSFAEANREIGETGIWSMALAASAPIRRPAIAPVGPNTDSPSAAPPMERRGLPW
jgi:hypothetical protein